MARTYTNALSNLSTFSTLHTWVHVGVSSSSQFASALQKPLTSPCIFASLLGNNSLVVVGGGGDVGSIKNTMHNLGGCSIFSIFWQGQVGWLYAAPENCCRLYPQGPAA
jgi:hypothetical protein